MSDSEEYSSAKRYKRDETTSDLETSPILIDSDPDKSILDTKIFNDPIHGSIELHWLLVKLIDTPEFQRLRRLRQVGLAYYVYPGACHQRFEHSIGTCYLAGELLTRLCQKQPELNITPKDILCVQMAALCHDLGHGPFSHTFEDVITILRPELHWIHEHASVQMFDHLIEKNRLLPFFQQVGLNDIDIIFVKELIYSEIDGQDNTQEVKACYEIYRIRDDLHRRAYQHPVVKGIELMLREALIAANDYLFFCNAAGRCDTRLAHTIDDMYTFSQVDDHIVTLIKHSYHPNMDKAKEILEKIERREIYRYIGNTHIKFTADFQKKECQNACHDIIKYCHFNENQSHITENDLVIQTVDLTCGDRGEDPIQNMWFYTKISPNKATKISKEQVSTFLPQTFREHDLRLYCKTRDPTVCSIVRCAFKEFCIAKGYAVPKGSDLWMAISPISEQRLTSFAGIAIQVMSKSNKNQKSITSFFKNPAQSATNEPATSKSKSALIPEIKKEPGISKLPPPEPVVKPVVSPKKPAVIVCPTIAKIPNHETEWINLSDRFILTNRNFDVQYAHLYAERLGAMRKMVAKAAENHLGFKSTN
ncbi:unnamed protein product [Rotaria magnacalcarata]|uniref:HD/PDEase domain-containing protein n=2 Tax=Rotaria magnacalcarata TaxID=392030 RepID=A0A8S2SFJ2_9BILA|nr:unnamed protein product [Rotaria magnacalcarata]